MLVMSGLLYAVHWFLYASIALIVPDEFKRPSDYAHVVSWVLLPVTGWIAESWLGRYRAIVAGLVLSLVTILTTQIAFVMLQFNCTPIPIIVIPLLSTGLLIGTFGIGSFYTNMLPFALDQMIGASAEQLSAVVQWYSWGVGVGDLLQEILRYVPIPNQLRNMDILPVIYLTLATLCLSAVLIMDCLYHKWLDTNNKTGNPIKLIFQVLNYARKNKCPRLRSALTYIDEEHPSRLDFGKHKFGGPFTEEEVEDVKTIFRLTPVVVLTCGVIFFSEFAVSPILANNSFTFKSAPSQIVIKINDTALYFILIPIYRFIVYPLVRKRIPSLLKMTGAGLVLCFISTVIFTAVFSVEHFSEQSHNITMPDTPQMSLYWIIVVEFLNGLGTGMAMMYALEFTMAQTPNRMRGIMMGVALFTIGWSTVGSHLFTGMLKKCIPQTILFYLYLALPLPAMLVLTLVFTATAKRYKLRERERHVNIQAIVEEHYERYFDQEEEYLREEEETLSIRS